MPGLEGRSGVIGGRGGTGSRRMFARVRGARA